MASVMSIQAEIPIGLVVVMLLLMNFHQQQAFFEHLDNTGGVGKTTNALTRLAEEALTAQGREVYFFPEWGFFPSFNLLTGNRVPYELELDSTKIQKFAQSHRDIRLLFWKESDTEKYMSLLKHEGMIVGALRPFYQRDGKPAFYMISASYPDRLLD
jgi:hypothetical protein